MSVRGSNQGSNSNGNAVVNWWNGQQLAVKFSIGLGALILLVILAAVIKVIFDKARLRKHIKRERVEREAKAHGHTEAIAIKRLSNLEEGDLFGVRAIQSGFFGGVAQSAPSSPVGSRAPSLYNQPTTPSGPLNNGSSPYMPLMHPHAGASPMGSTTSLPLTRSPLGLNPMQSPTTPFSPSHNPMLRDPQRPGTAGSNHGPEQRPALRDRQDSDQSSRTINLDGLAPAKQQSNNTSSLRPSASDASNTSPPSTNNGTSQGSRSSSFTSTYSFEQGTEKQPQNPTIVKSFDGLPTLPVIQPLSAEVYNLDSRRPSPAPSTPTTFYEAPTSPPPRSAVTAELAGDLQQSPPHNKQNFSAPFKRPSQTEKALPLSPELGPLPAAAMNGGPQQFGGSRSQSPAPMNIGPPLSRNESPLPFPPRGASNGVDRSMSPAPRTMSPAPRTMSPGPRTMSPGPNNQMSRQNRPYGGGPVGDRRRNNSLGPQQRRPSASSVQPNSSMSPSQRQQPSLPAFLQNGQGSDGLIHTTELEMPRYPFSNNEPRSAPPTRTNTSQFFPNAADNKSNRLTAEILGDVYDSYSYKRNRQELSAQQTDQRGFGNNGSGARGMNQNQNQKPPQDFEMQRMQMQSSTGPRFQQQGAGGDRRLI